MRRVGLEGAYMMTGGVAQNPGVVRAVEELIGEKLFISLPTVKMHRSSAFTKLGVKSALEAYWMLETIGVVEKGAGRSRD